MPDVKPIVQLVEPDSASPAGSVSVRDLLAAARSALLKGGVMAAIMAAAQQLAQTTDNFWIAIGAGMVVMFGATYTRLHGQGDKPTDKPKPAGDTDEFTAPTGVGW